MARNYGIKVFMLPFLLLQQLQWRHVTGDNTSCLSVWDVLQGIPELSLSVEQMQKYSNNFTEQLDEPGLAITLFLPHDAVQGCSARDSHAETSNRYDNHSGSLNAKMWEARAFQGFWEMTSVPRQLCPEQLVAEGQTDSVLGVLSKMLQPVHFKQSGRLMSVSTSEEEAHILASYTACSSSVIYVVDDFLWPVTRAWNTVESSSLDLWAITGSDDMLRRSCTCALQFPILNEQLQNASDAVEVKVIVERFNIEGLDSSTACGGRASEREAPLPTSPSTSLPLWRVALVILLAILAMALMGLGVAYVLCRRRHSALRRKAETCSSDVESNSNNDKSSQGPDSTNLSGLSQAHLIPVVNLKPDDHLLNNALSFNPTNSVPGTSPTRLLEFSTPSSDQLSADVDQAQTPTSHSSHVDEDQADSGESMQHNISNVSVLDDCKLSLDELTVFADANGQPVVLGRGAFGVVHFGLHRGVQNVAIKVFFANSQLSERSKLRILREVSHLKSCRDPNIIQFLGACFCGQQLMMVMELMRGGDLFSALQGPRRNHFMWAEQGRRIALDVARGLCYLHGHHIVHCDIKPQNVLLSDQQGSVAKICDFGMSNMIAQGYLASVSATGTFAWAAPELLLGLKVTFAVDMFGFGVLLWQIVTGILPVRGRIDIDLLDGRCPATVKDLIDRCLEANPQARPTAKEAHDIILESINIGRLSMQECSMPLATAACQSEEL